MELKSPYGIDPLRIIPIFPSALTALDFSPDGRYLLCATRDSAIYVWDMEKESFIFESTRDGVSALSATFNPNSSGVAASYSDGSVVFFDFKAKKTKAIDAHPGQWVASVIYSSDGRFMATCGTDGVAKIWNQDFVLMHSVEGGRKWVNSISFIEIDKKLLLICSYSDGFFKVWDFISGDLLHSKEAHHHGSTKITCSPDYSLIISCGWDKTIKIWSSKDASLLRILEGHSGPVEALKFSPDGNFLVSKGRDGRVIFWDARSWSFLAELSAPAVETVWPCSIAIAKKSNAVAFASSHVYSSENEKSRRVEILSVSYERLISAKSINSVNSIHHKTAKIVVVGDHAVGKSALVHRLINGDFERQESTHGQKFFIMPFLSGVMDDGADCDAIIWDFAGQPDYRMVHALSIDNSDLALVLFDSSDIRDPLHGALFWIRQLRSIKNYCPIVLVASQIDRGTVGLTVDEIRAICDREGVSALIYTSAYDGTGFDQLIDVMRKLLDWNNKVSIVTTLAFKKIKDILIRLKESKNNTVFISRDDLDKLISDELRDDKFTKDQIDVALSHLENYGYLRRLRTSKGGDVILLQPERLNNLASSIILEARRNQKGLGAIEEKALSLHQYDFPELKGLSEGHKDILIDSAIILFIKNNVCFREIDPLRLDSYVIFPALINLTKPAGELSEVVESTFYTVKGATENLFSSLVVLMGYTNTFVRINQWKGNAQYEISRDLICGFKLISEADAEIELSLYFSQNVGLTVRTLFQAQFESFLSKKDITVRRQNRLACENKKCMHPIDFSIVKKRLSEAKAFVFCPECGTKTILGEDESFIELSREIEKQVVLQDVYAEKRNALERILFRVKNLVFERNINPPSCFVSYAWGVQEHEDWVERRLASDLQKAGIIVVLDKWDNNRIGSSIPRFVERVFSCDKVIVVGSEAYREKYENKQQMRGYVVAAEGDLIGKRLLGGEADKMNVLPVLAQGEALASFPNILQGRVYADFRSEADYYESILELIFDIYSFDRRDSAIFSLKAEFAS